MSAAARAIGWELHRRSRWGAIALGVYMVVFWIVRLMVLGPGQRITVDPPNGLASFVIAPVTWTYFYFVVLFSYGLQGDLAARQSIYPARMLTLPVTNAALVGWPMLYGTATAVGLWLVTALVLTWPAGLDAQVPWVWPALLFAAYLAWMQALTWMPYGLRGLRVIVAALWLIVIDVIVLVAIHMKASELVMVALLAPQLPLAYLVARIAVARARRGDVPDWSGVFAGLGRSGAVLPRARDRAMTPARAQAWFEWRLHGWALPSLVALVVPVELLLLFIPGNDTAPVVFVTLFVVLLTPPLLAIFAAATVSTSSNYMKTRPLTSAALVAAKLEATVWSTAAAWLLVLLAIPLALGLSGTWPVAVERARALIEVTGTLRAMMLALLILAALWASTWKNLVQSLCIGLTDREWLVKSTALLALSVVVFIGMALEWVYTSREARDVIWNAVFPWVFVALVCLKAGAACWIAIRLYDSRLLTDRALVTGAASWLAAVLAIYGVLAWMAASPIFPRYLLGAIAILIVPFARIAAAPLALAWNRHR